MRQWKREMCFEMPDGDWRLIRPTVNDVGRISAAPFDKQSVRSLHTLYANFRCHQKRRQQHQAAGNHQG